MKHLLSFVLLFLAPLLAISQTGQELEAARLAMVKEGVKFYASLPDLNGAHKDYSCGSARTVDEVADCAAGMQGVAPKIRSWGSKPYASAGDLDKLRNTILSGVLGSKADERKKMPAYTTLSNRLTELSKPAGAPTGPAPEQPVSTDAGTSPETATPAGDAPVTDVDMNTPMDSATGLPAEADSQTESSTVESKTGKAAGTSWLTWLALLVAIGSAAYAYLTTATLRRQLQENLGTLRTGGEAGDKDLARQVKMQDIAIQNLMKEVEDVRRVAMQKTAPSERLPPVPKAGSQPQPLAAKQQSGPTEKRQPVPPAPTPPAPTRPDQLLRDIPGQPAPKAAAAVSAGSFSDPALPVIATFFARFADAGDGFTNTALSQEPDDKRIFEISLNTPHRGTYRVSQNPAAQRFALTNTSLYLGPTTRYSSVPQPGSSIVTEKPGVISLQGDKWVIEEPATISFV